jgi:three-Cys-motif partner protein
MAQVRSWTQKKLRLLEKYLGVYMTIMDAQRRKGLFRRVVYIDAFAGPGRYDDESGDQQKYLEGSPFRALKIPKPFDEYWFIEKDAARAQRLRENLEADPETTGLLAEGKIRIFCKDANEVLRGDACAEIRYEDYARALVFLDPYGLEVAFATVEDLAGSRAFELFVNFSLMGVNRLLRRQGPPEEWAKSRLEQVFGDRSWEDLYTQAPNMFGDELEYRGRVLPERVADLYSRRLEKCFPHVSKPKIMLNSKNAPLYALMLASHSPVAKKLMDHLVRLSST